MLLLGQERAVEAPAVPDLAEVGRRTYTEVTDHLNVPHVPADSLVTTTGHGRQVAHAEHRHRHVAGSAQIAARFLSVLAGHRRELFLAIALDAKNRVTHEFRIAEGTPTSCSVCPQEVFQPLFRVGAARAILVHNHPSGNPEPSRQDIEITTLLAFAGETLGIRVLDHVILGDWDHYSFSDSGLLRRGRRL